MIETPTGRIFTHEDDLAGFASNMVKFDKEIGNPVWPHEWDEGQVENAIETVDMQRNIKKFDTIFASKFWGAFMTGFKKDSEQLRNVTLALPKLEKFMRSMIKNLTIAGGDTFLSGYDIPMYIDYHVAPLLERLVMLKDSPWHKAYEAMNLEKNAPTVLSLVKEYNDHPFTRDVMMRRYVFHDYLKKWEEEKKKPKLYINEGPVFDNKITGAKSTE